MSDAGLRSWKRQRAGRPVEALAAFAPWPRPPEGTHSAENQRVERHYRKCGFHQNSPRDPSHPIITISPTPPLIVVFSADGGVV